MAFLYHVRPGSWRVWPCYLARPFHLLGRYGRVVARVATRGPEAVAAAQDRIEKLWLEEWFSLRGGGSTVVQRQVAARRCQRRGRRSTRLRRPIVGPWLYPFSSASRSSTA